MKAKLLPPCVLKVTREVRDGEHRRGTHQSYGKEWPHVS